MLRFAQRKGSQPCETGDNTKRPIPFVAFVQMQPDGDHLCHHCRWRLHVENSRLDRPRAKVRSVFSLTHCYRSVLVPYNFPVRVGSLVKQDTSYRKALLVEKGSDGLLNGFRNCQFAHYGNSKQVSLSVAVVTEVTAEIFHGLPFETLG